LNDCPVPLSRYDRVAMGHGGGGRLTAELIERLFLRAYGNEVVGALEDQAVVPAPGQRIAITTDAFVVRPLFFPGGDIGKLAVCGTVNDLAVGGARPLYLTAAFVLEEGFPLADLERIALSMRDACALAGVRLVAGDTKVVERGKGDGVYLTTTGVGVVPDDLRLSIAAARPGDRILVSGPVGDHGIAILALREGIDLETELASDCAPVIETAQSLLAAAPGLRCMRDPTRGGLATVLCELAVASSVGVHLDERAVPVRDEVRGACELLGLDPLYVACDGRLVAVIPPDQADSALAALRVRDPAAALVGAVVDAPTGQVTATTVAGGERLVPMLAGEQLPRIC